MYSSHYTPKGGWQPTTISPNVVLMGVELEVEANEEEEVECTHEAVCNCDEDYEDTLSIIDSYVNSRPNFCTKDDSSLYCGIEIVSHPMPIGEHKRAWGPVLNKLNKLGFEGDNANSAGLHIHFETNPKLNDKMVEFLVKNKKKVVDLAGREPNDFCEWWQIEKDHTDRELSCGCHCKPCCYHSPIGHYLISKPGQLGQIPSDNHYSVINITSHKPYLSDDNKVYEFRAYQSTINPIKFFGRIEFVDAMVKFVRTPQKDLLWPTFTSWVKSKGRWNNLERIAAC